MAQDSNSRLVYSTDGGRVKAAPHNRKPQPPPPPPRAGIPDDGVVRLMRGPKGRGGSPSTLILGLSGSEADLDAFLKRFKQLCGAGGSRDGRELLIQGDHRERIKAELEKAGHAVKLAGG